MKEIVMTLVANRRVIEIEMERDDVPQSMGVVVRIDGERRWSSEEPGWRELGVGAAGDRVYFWSARRLVALPIDDEPEALIFDTDEDILVSFAHEQGFLLVCETSVRLVSVGDESARLELPDVIDFVRWRDDGLEVRDAAGASHQVAVSEGRLCVVS